MKKKPMKVNKFFQELGLGIFSQLFLLLDGHPITVNRSDRITLVRFRTELHCNLVFRHEPYSVRSGNNKKIRVIKFK